MAAGQGFKTFTTGEVLTAADVNGYLMQGILVFASEAARNAAITSPQEGQFAFTKDNNSLWYYTGSAWVASGATGDIEGVTAGVGISGGGTSGTVTITNDMATTITAAGDIVLGTGSGTYDNLPIGTTGQILTADTTVSPYKVKWATPASGGGITKILATTFSAVSSYTAPANTFSATYNQYTILLEITSQSASTDNQLRLRSGSTDETSSNYTRQIIEGSSSSAGASQSTTTFWNLGGSSTNTRFAYRADFFNPFGTGQHLFLSQVFRLNSSSAFVLESQGGRLDTATSYDSFTLYPASGTITGRIAVYGYNL
jgi:hypothetical protein